VGAGAASAAAPSIEELQGKLQDTLKTAGLGDSTAKTIASLAGGTTAAAIGAAASGGSTAGAATAFNADMNNRQLHPSEVQKAKELAAKSGGKYKQSEIEEQMRLMGNAATGELPNTTTVLTTTAAVEKSYKDDPNMPRTAQGPVVLEVPGQANPELQAWIINNTKEGAGFIPGASPYSASNAGLIRPTTTNTPSTAPVTAACANNDLACRSGVGAQQSTMPQMTQAARQAIADGAETTSRQAGVIGAAATAATAAASPPVKPITGAVAVGATVIGVAADAVEQLARPDAEKIIKEQILMGIPADALAKKYPLYAPLINEIKEATK
jgi:filamentous hemagglutinin